MNGDSACAAHDILRELIFRHSGIHLSTKEEGVLRARVARRLRELGLADPAGYAALLQGPEGCAEIPALLDAITINYTFFFREEHQFQFLGAEAVPRILRERREGDGTAVRAWSAGCSSGEEAYSMAIALWEGAGPRASWNFRVLATDINRRVLRRGASGIYPESRLGGVPQAYFYKYFHRDAETPSDSLRVCPEIRDRVVFRRANILVGAPKLRGLFDVVFCRNVMIYFDAPTQAALLRDLYASLRPGGYLFLSSSECPVALPGGFSSVGKGIYRRP